MSYTEGTDYQGWKNRETWNVQLWMGNEYALYCVMRGYKTYATPYLSMRQDLKTCFNFERTRDGVSLWDQALDIEALNEYIKEC